jgi:hypothetical protein
LLDRHRFLRRVFGALYAGAVRPGQGHHHPRRPAHLPQEIEDAVSAIPGLIKNGVAAFGVTDAAAGTERTIVMDETAEKGPEQRRQLQARARDVATDILGTPPDDVVLLPPQTVPQDVEPQDPSRRRARC